jgi:2,3-bisphosphoglycerate-independent phosphoglycerate mutase
MGAALGLRRRLDKPTPPGRAVPKQPGLLVILDGFAYGDPDHPCNAVALANTPTFDRLRRECPVAMLRNNGEHVGLPPGQMGNSEVGHLNIGAGRVVKQDFPRINDAVADGSIANIPVVRELLGGLKARGGRLHLIGLLGPGGIHAHEGHVAGALQAAKAAGIHDVWVHPIGDGRDTPPRSAHAYLKTLEAQMAKHGGRIADFVGRYYAMDRDQRWERTEAAYRLYREGKGHRASDAHGALDAAYARGEGDEFVTATNIDPDGVVRDGDAVWWLNFRPDRSRQMTRAFKQPDFAGFARPMPQVDWLCMTQYDRSFLSYPGLAVAFRPAHAKMTLAEQLSKLGLTQMHLAETEKYAHVTYFLNGGHEQPFPGEERVLVPSPKVATYNLQPEMSAGLLTDKVLEALGGGFDFIVVNYANPDMVGHTGDLDATIRAMEFVDNCIHRVLAVATELGFVTLITSDHGNAEEMCKRLPDGGRGEPVTKHSMNPSPLIAVNAGRARLEAEGSLSQVAPTMLELMGLPVPAEMTAPSLVTWPAGSDDPTPRAVPRPKTRT